MYSMKVSLAGTKTALTTEAVKMLYSQLYVSIAIKQLIDFDVASGTPANQGPVCRS